MILPFAAHWVANEVALNDELDDARWLVPGHLGNLPITLGLEATITAARSIAGV